MGRRGVFVEGRFLRCGEPTRTGSAIPRCIGLAVMGSDRCTCHPWTPQQFDAAIEASATAESRSQMLDAFVDAGWTYRLAMRLLYPEDVRFQARGGAR